MAIEFSGFLYNASGAAVASATVNLYDRNTTTPVRATTTTNASGYWAISHGTEGRFDVEIVNGTTYVRLKYDDAVQLESLETAQLTIRNPADTFSYDIVPGAITADRTLNLPVITGTDTVAVLGLAQTFSAIKTFSAIPVMSGGAVGFPATQAASATANDLDDYEEGTWTPGISFGGGSTGITYDSQFGYYTKVGNMVHCWGNLTLSAKGSSTGTARVTGLPFTIANVSGNNVPIALHMTTVTFANAPQALAESNATTIKLGEITEGGAETDLTDTDFAATSAVRVAASFRV